MPQMAPLSWLSLYFTFILVFIIFIVTNYYSFLYQPLKKSKISKKTSINWKW
uniref:ATP synthase complex subunit 8 n=1 Tax=Laparocerus freyi TaxID=1763381 RepID=A0A3G2JZB1_9CUCU|nr:ATP synthase F0 subunit 8 [Laparocerus freyi]